MFSNKKKLKDVHGLSNRELIALLWNNCVKVGNHMPEIENLVFSPNRDYKHTKAIAKIVLKRMRPNFNTGDKVIPKIAGPSLEEVRTVKEVVLYKGRWFLRLYEENSNFFAEDFVLAVELEKEVKEETVS